MLFGKAVRSKQSWQCLDGKKSFRNLEKTHKKVLHNMFFVFIRHISVCVCVRVCKIMNFVGFFLRGLWCISWFIKASSMAFFPRGALCVCVCWVVKERLCIHCSDWEKKKKKSCCLQVLETGVCPPVHSWGPAKTTRQQDVPVQHHRPGQIQKQVGMLGSFIFMIDGDHAAVFLFFFYQFSVLHWCLGGKRVQYFASV